MIRKAKLEDLNKIQKLIKIGSQNGRVLTRSKKDIRDHIKNFYVYEKFDKIIGCCSLDIYDQKIAEIRSVVVIEEFQSQGLGSELIRKCISDAKKKSVYEILVVTDKDRFFNKMGFKKAIDNKSIMFIKLGGVSE